MRAVLFETGEPMCELHVVLATEADTCEWAHKDDGLPHTLEHAIFLGSELYPYKGVLDKLANRCLARGTNAWTATDHTCYTMRTAGHEGLLNLLPIYADHILYPLLSDESFVTEVHHVTNEGENKGVVYCEMQGRENTADSLVDRAVMELLYPKGGYSAETGGKMANLRKLTNEQVRRYHAQFYRPDNMMIVVSGTAGEAEFLSSLEAVEKRVLEKGGERTRRTPRPWAGHVASMETETEGVLLDSGMRGKPKQVLFPSEDESTGIVSLAWRGPRYDEHRAWVELYVLWEYLTDSAVAPLTKKMVEIDLPFCSRIKPAYEVFSQGYHQVWFRDARCELMDWIVADFFAVVGKAMDEFDLDRMKLVIRRYRRKLLERRERAPTDAAMGPLIASFLYAPRHGSQDQVDEVGTILQVEAQLAEIEKLDAADWQRRIAERILDPPCVAVVGCPSAETAKRIASEAEALTSANARRLGSAGLVKCAEILDAAIAHNEREIPAKYLTAVPIPSPASVRLIPVLTVRGSKKLEIAENSGGTLSDETKNSVLRILTESKAKHGSAFDPYWVEWEHIDSVFVSVAVALDTSTLSPSERKYVPLLLELAFKLPCVLDDGSDLTKDEAVSQLQADTTRYSASFGLLNGRIAQFATVFVQVELDGGAGLAKALAYVRRALYLTSISPEELRIAGRKMLSLAPAAVRDGAGIARHLSESLEFDVEQNNNFVAHATTQQPFITAMLNGLEDARTAHTVVEKFEQVRELLLQPQLMQVFVAGDVTKLADPYASLVAALTPPSQAVSDRRSSGGGRRSAAARRSTSTKRMSPKRSFGAPARQIAHSNILSGATGKATIASLSAVESNFLRTCAPGVAAYADDHASLLVAIEHLTALEGDFWVKLRGAGLTYSYQIAASTDTQRISFVLFKCTDLLGAYAAAKKIVVEYAKGESAVTPVALDGAKATVAYSIISGASTRLGAAAAAWSTIYEGKKVDYATWLLDQVSKVTVSDVLHSLKKYIVPLFDPSANLAATCPTNKVELAKQGFEEMLGIEVRVMTEEQICCHPEQLAKDGHVATTATDDATDDATTDAGASSANADTDADADKQPAKATKTSKKLPTVTSTSGADTAPFAFARQFKCECPKCAVPAVPAL
uniref:Peptidase M16C associated domain-containing protein n=1 Tax=Chrysotila carterae TaxID=13221 RepID=A0A7S4B5T8_CHRCT